MSDKVSFAVMVCEGIHDVMSVVKILSLKSFREITTYSEIPEQLAQKMIPTKYPCAREGDRLTWSVPHPSFLERDGYYIVVSNANGKDRLGENLYRLLGLARQEVLDGLKAIAVVADADLVALAEKEESICRQLVDSFAEQPDFGMDTFLSGEISAYGKAVPAFFYVLPDHEGEGTLEHLLLAGAAVSYPDLLSGAVSYVDAAKERYGRYLGNFNANKAVVGVVSNILKPGKPNQASIQDNDWFTADSLIKLPLHKKFSDFIDRFIAPLTMDEG